jgi:hypothetical protein
MFNTELPTLDMPPSWQAQWYVQAPGSVLYFGILSRWAVYWLERSRKPVYLLGGKWGRPGAGLVHQAESGDKGGIGFVSLGSRGLCLSEGFDAGRIDDALTPEEGPMVLRRGQAVHCPFRVDGPGAILPGPYAGTLLLHATPDAFNTMKDIITCLDSPPAPFPAQTAKGKRVKKTAATKAACPEPPHGESVAAPAPEAVQEGPH